MAIGVALCFLPAHVPLPFPAWFFWAGVTLQVSTFILLFLRRKTVSLLGARSFLFPALAFLLISLNITRPLVSRMVEKERIRLQNKRFDGNYLHLHTKGGWAIDGDRWVFPDDTFRVRYQHASDGTVVEDWEGSNPGAFQRIVLLTDSCDGWRLTSTSLQHELESIERESRSVFGVMDTSHAYLEFRLSAKNLTADFYAADAYAEHYPNTMQISDFSKLQRAIYDETEQR